MCLRGIVSSTRRGVYSDRPRRWLGASPPPLYGLVNNAAVSAFGWCEFLPLSRYRANIEVNLLGVVRLTKACLPLLRHPATTGSAPTIKGVTCWRG